MGTAPGAGDQLQLSDLPPARARSTARSAKRSGPRKAPTLAASDPVARVAVDVSLPHLDRTFDYSVTEAQSADAQPGVRVRVRFSGQLVDGFVVERLAATDHEGRLSRLSSVVSPLPVLTPAIAALCRAVADRYAGTMADVVRLAIPPRHAAVEREHLAAQAAHRATASKEAGNDDLAALPTPTRTGGWEEYRNGSGLIDALESGGTPRAGWCALPGVDGSRPAWAAAAADAVVATALSRRGSIIVVPDHGDVEVVAAAVEQRHIDAVVLTADQGPRERYRRWLHVLTGSASPNTPTVVVGTRSAVYAPVQRLGLILVWDDGNDLHSEPRAPYPHVREVAAQRSSDEGTALLIGGLHRTAEVAAMISRGFLQSVVAERARVRAAAPRTRASSDSSSSGDPMASVARLPTVAWRAARDALNAGPVLVQVPRGGYLPRLACARCGESARCTACQGPLAVPQNRQGATCGWCGQAAGAWRCPSCGGEQLRSQVVGARRTAEELGRAFPGVAVVTSGGRSVRSTVSADPALVVATPGAEPLAPDGYAAGVLLDAWALLGRPDMRAAEETLRRWMSAAALVRGSERGGHVVVVADAGLRAVQALVRWDPVGFAEAELADREQVGLPPARRVAVLRGAPGDVQDLVSRTQLPSGTDTLGPVAVAAPIAGVGESSAESRSRDPQVQVVLRASRRSGLQLASAVAAAQGERSVRKAKGWVTVRIDPVDWG